jgi:hypothetical protein
MEMIMRMGILDPKKRDKGQIYLNLRDEGYEILKKVEDKMQNYPYFDSDTDPRVDEDVKI